MAEIMQGGGGGHGKHDKKRAKKMSTRVDMTPMVDLAFLLLTFFVLTSTFSKPKVLRMIFPEKIKDIKNKPVKKDGLTLIVSGDNKLYYYDGKLDPAKGLTETNYSKDGLRKLLLEKNSRFLNIRKQLEKRLNQAGTDSAKIRGINAELDSMAAKTSLAVIVRHDETATYRSMIDVVDEFLITQVATYFVSDQPLTKDEKTALAKVKK